MQDQLIFEDVIEPSNERSIRQDNIVFAATIDSIDDAPGSAAVARLARDVGNVAGVVSKQRKCRIGEVRTYDSIA